MKTVMIVIGLCLLWAGSSQAESLLIAGRGPLLIKGAALVKASATPSSSDRPSLFSGLSGNSLFRPTPPRITTLPPGPAFGQLDRLRTLIGEAESVSHGYNAVQHGSKIRPLKTPTRMSLREIYQWIDATPGQPHAIGRYQFIPKTLRRLVRQLELPLDTLFTAEIQDRLSDVLLAEAGLQEFRSGRLSQQAFMHNLSKIWAGLPTSSGRSYYHGFAGNKASISWEYFETAMASIFS